MTALAWLGLVIALLGVPLLSLLGRRFGLDPLGWSSRLALWALAAAVLAIALALPGGTDHLGLGAPTASTWVLALTATLALGAVFPLVGAVQSRLGFQPTEKLAQFKQLAALPFGYRVFIVLTAGVTEEVLYRGYAIGIGAQLFGSVGVAAVLSLLVFTVAHLRWGLGHLISVLIAGGALTLLFVLTGDLWACMLAHALVDAMGVLVAPAVMARRGRLRADATDGAASDR
ncbi:MAG: CPBP family intramembrane glutamic endopeptidase [Betaproteobacteria bacterium]